MKIAIDLNDVIRDYSDNFLKTYIERYNREYSLDGFEMYTNEMKVIFPFKSDGAYNTFVYDDFAFELFGKCPTCRRSLPADISKWMNDTIPNLDTDEPVDVVFLSTMEFGNSIGFTYFFISKLNVPVREVILPTDSFSMWDKFDVLVTANPLLLEYGNKNKRTVVKIEQEYNKEIPCKYSFCNLSKFMEDENNVIELLNNEEKSE